MLQEKFSQALYWKGLNYATLCRLGGADALGCSATVYYYICVLILYVRPHTTIYVSSYSIRSVASGVPMRSC